MKERSFTLEEYQKNYQILSNIYNFKRQRYKEAKAKKKQCWYEMATARTNLNYFIKTYGKYLDLKDK